MRLATPAHGGRGSLQKILWRRRGKGGEVGVGGLKREGGGGQLRGGLWGGFVGPVGTTGG